jgi:nanoRNase/pAp phosphatase (c-di-AMP/oligoRNAs hydrolase)
MRTPFDLDEALDSVRHCRRILICPHDDPDPDALASAWGLSLLLSTELDAEVVIAFDGIIGRAENRAMVRELGIKLRRLDKLDPASFDGAALVDTQPAASNHSLPAGIPVIVCVDHHDRQDREHSFRWYDVRPNEETSSSIVLGYLRQRGIEPDDKLSTAILYALKTDTRDFTREAGPLDIAAHDYVSGRADLEALGAIVNPRLDTRYFRMLHRMLDATLLHGRATVAYLGEMPYPDLVAEMADLLVRRRGTEWCLCAGTYKGHLRCSLRTEDDRGGAGDVAVALVKSRGGSAGGHGMTAGGHIVLPEDGADERARELWDELAREFLVLVDAPDGAEALCPRATGEHLAVPVAGDPDG